MKHLFHILLLFLLAHATAFAQVDSTAYVQAQADSIIVDNTIKETIKLDDVSFETIVHKDGKYYAVVKTDAGEIEEVDITYSVDGKKRVAIEDKDGKQLVVDKNGEMPFLISLLNISISDN
ncbi:MAG: hypothetical protein MJZ13_02970 [Bacteroidales bacterium]|nr:hypothetical protein [Bacteroidales bacterium]